MGVEIERKFLVQEEAWALVEKGKGELYRQAYILTDPEKTIRVRIAGGRGFLTIKGKTSGTSRAEFEYEIPASDAEALLDGFAGAGITKRRYRILHEGKTWEVDEFDGDNKGLLMAEIELGSESEVFSMPPWAGREVSSDKRYYNSSLSLHPFTKW